MAGAAAVVDSVVVACASRMGFFDLTAAFAVVACGAVACAAVAGCAYAAMAPAPQSAMVPVARARLTASASSRFVLIQNLLWAVFSAASGIAGSLLAEAEPALSKGCGCLVRQGGAQAVSAWRRS